MERSEHEELRFSIETLGLALVTAGPWVETQGWPNAVAPRLFV
ncbi:hypothetical protein RISK_003515 [Rhodopirellula islandica]|uniref:Uncharacterized protein n=1 Tax=Rhodopirellula islandica TaxID=595434 RepID=A0A0J1BD93_RHOIS|nr:hypothetical protein RISK_003515 [Rhodopirellula islandica]